MTGRLPPASEATVTPSGSSDRRARYPGLVIMTSALMAWALTFLLGDLVRHADLGISARVVNRCTVSTDTPAPPGAAAIARDDACAAQREARSRPASSLSNSTVDREDRVTETSYIF